ncbi:hypothetical protein RC452_004364 [Salmonella enterica]|nr:hypothetical protein [Salmonella enterica]EKL9635062.1 hypothetical protein [Salmonella enterica]ELD9771021.1 hypothetical protein [Salmonella enterica]
MADSAFIREVNHRASLLTGSFNPGRAINWVRQEGNIQRIYRLQSDTRQYLAGDIPQYEVSEFWRGIEGSPEIKAFISCLDSGAQVLIQRGRKGDIYSVPVLHCVVRHFIQHYLKCTPEIMPESAGEA